MAPQDVFPQGAANYVLAIPTRLSPLQTWSARRGSSPCRRRQARLSINGVAIVEGSVRISYRFRRSIPRHFSVGVFTPRSCYEEKVQRVGRKISHRLY